MLKKITTGFKIITGLLFLSTTLYAQSSPHGSSMRFECSECHITASWKIPGSAKSFNHALTGFELTGRHRTADCIGCHKDLVFSRTSAECRDCHNEPHQNTLGKDCANCHTPSSWKPIDMVQKHNQFRFTLTGVHNIPDCKACHLNADNFIYSGASIDCYSCHMKDYQKTTNPAHAVMGLSAQCDQCHTLRSANWTAEKFVHVRISLKGPHSQLKCNQCHTTSHVTQQCYDCHQKDYMGAKDPNHLSANFPHDCLQCHNSDNWLSAKFNHSATKFPLTGAHINAQCSQCHSNGYAGTSTDCYSCHKDTYTATMNPSHAAIGISTDCTKCHSTQAWTPSGFSHTATGFPLSGAHESQQCSACHKGSNSGLSIDCFSCHQQDYNRAENHAAQGYPHTCEQCHNTNSWDGAAFNHSATNFPLTGAHRSVSCQQCHTSGYKGTSTQCSSCHIANYNNAANPNHASAGISTDCSVCHTTAAWIPSGFSHASTGFTLTGAHINLQCSSCHKGTTSGLNINCYSCHQADYTRAANHASQGYPQTCEQCHSTASWSGSAFNHSATVFPLTGAHNTVSCSQCHTSGFAGTTTVCGQCHLSKYQSTSNPNHMALSIANTCEQCHTTNPGWKPASFPVHNNYWVLDGAHVAVSNCAACHNGSYSSTPNTCFGCHKPDYDKTANPSHASLNFSQDCQSCHTKTAWNPASYRNHDVQFFPIYSGKHSGRWSSCTTCHPNSTNYREFTCLTGNCHPQASMDREHRGRSGYSYTSSACYNCHPRGNSLGLMKTRANIQY